MVSETELLPQGCALNGSLPAEPVCNGNSSEVGVVGAGLGDVARREQGVQTEVAGAGGGAVLELQRALAAQEEAGRRQRAKHDRHLTQISLQVLTYSRAAICPFFFLPENTKYMYFCVIRQESEWTNKDNTVL